jgi:hypothetical protein
MKFEKTIKSCLIISYGPVPTPQYQTVEGGGMRAWGLADGLKANGIRVTIAVNNSFPQEIQEHEGVHLANWGQDQALIDLMNTYDAVIVSYCMGSDSTFIADNISDSVQLILDAYVPIYVEVSARESQDIDHEYRHYMEDIQRFNRVLRRGDYFLCANEAQKTLYIGVLASLGVINPRSYRQDRIIIAPFGIHSVAAESEFNPYKRELGIGSKGDFVALWFGGLYPWFRVEELLAAILELSKDPSFKFVIVGGKNPFNPNPDFQKQYDKTLAFAEKHKLVNKTVFFVDWVDFNKRINWFKHADIVVSLNQPGEENGFSWRTRVMDFVWGELAILTNGGDPLSEDLIRAGAALRLNELSAQEIIQNLKSAQKDPAVLKTIRSRIVDLKKTYYWEALTKPIAELIAAGESPYQEEKSYRERINVKTPGEISPATTAVAPNAKIHKIKRVAKLPIRILSYAKTPDPIKTCGQSKTLCLYFSPHQPHRRARGSDADHSRIRR